MNINSQVIKAINTALNAIFNKAFSDAPTYWQKIAMTIPSVHASNTYGWLGAIPGLRKWIGDRVVQNISTNGQVIENQEFEGTVAVKANDIEDDNVGIYHPIIGQLGYNAKTHPDEQIFDLLKNGTSLKCYDGQNYFDTDHPVLVDDKATSVSNYFKPASNSVAPWYLLDTSRPIKPVIFQERRPYKLTVLDKDTDEAMFKRREILYGVDGRNGVGFAFWQMAVRSEKALTSTSFAEARTAMISFKGDNGKTLGLKPNILLVGPSNEAAARELITTDRLANGASNPWKDAVEIFVVPYLD